MRRLLSAVNMTLSIVIPAFNEAGRLATTLTALRDFLGRHDWVWEIRVVDDGSTDDSVGIAERFADGDHRFIVQREPHRGKGGAVKAGLLAARGDFRFICDADLSMAIHELERFMPPSAPPFDIAIGTREGASARRIGEPVYRHLIGRAFNGVVQLAALPGIEDSQCGFKMFTAAAVARIFPIVEVTGWAFDVEVLAIARAQRFRIVEVPIEWHYQKESRLSIGRDGLAMFRELLRIRGNIKNGRYALASR